MKSLSREASLPRSMGESLAGKPRREPIPQRPASDGSSRTRIAVAWGRQGARPQAFNRPACKYPVRPRKVAGIAAGMALQVVLVLRLRLPEVPTGSTWVTTLPATGQRH